MLQSFATKQLQKRPTTIEYTEAYNLGGERGIHYSSAQKILVNQGVIFYIILLLILMLYSGQLTC